MLKTKVWQDVADLLERGMMIATSARLVERSSLPDMLLKEMDTETQAFLNGWFPHECQRQIASIVQSIDSLAGEPEVGDFFRLALSSTIVCRSSPVTWSVDLSHGRARRRPDKPTGDAIALFTTRLERITRMLEGAPQKQMASSTTSLGDARDLSDKVDSQSVDLVVTSPPYLSAIDYIRAHKFSLVWMGWTVRDLTELRAALIGSERIAGWRPRHGLPDELKGIIHSVPDPRRGRIVARYFDDLLGVLREIARVLRTGGHAILTLGTGIVRGVTINIADTVRALASVDGSLSPIASVRRGMNRDRRSLPASSTRKVESKIERRMDSETVVCLQRVA